MGVHLPKTTAVCAIEPRPAVMPCTKVPNWPIDGNAPPSPAMSPVYGMVAYHIQETLMPNVRAAAQKSGLRKNAERIFKHGSECLQSVLSYEWAISELVVYSPARTAPPEAGGAAGSAGALSLSARRRGRMRMAVPATENWMVSDLFKSIRGIGTRTSTCMALAPDPNAPKNRDVNEMPKG